MLISDNIKQLHNVWTSTEILKYFDLPFDLLFLDRLKDLNDAFLIIVNIDAFKDLTIFTSSNFPDNFIVILLTGQRDIQRLGKHYFERYTEFVIC